MRRWHFFVFVCLTLIVSIPGFAAQDSFRFVVTGDSRGGDNGVNSAQLIELKDAIIAEQPQPELVIFTGDLVYNGTVAQLLYWVQIFMDPLIAHGIAVYPIRGNHDSNADAWQAVFSGAYALPDNGPPAELDMTYSFVHKNAQFIGMDVSGFMEVNQGWLDDQLAAKNVPHVFVFNHYPAFAVNHVDCLAMYPAKRDAFWNSIGQAGGKMYFTGHDHFYDHSQAYDIHGIQIHQIVAGSAGASLYDWDDVYREAPRVQGFSHCRDHGYVVVDVNGYSVQSVFKERIETQPGQVQYVNNGDVFTYTAWLPGQGLPLATAGALIAALLIVVFTIRRFVLN